MYKSIREVGPETKKSRIAAARWCGRPNCGCCGGTTVKGDLVGARLSDYDWEAKDAKFDKRQGRKKKTLRDHRGGNYAPLRTFPSLYLHRGKTLFTASERRFWRTFS